MKVEVDETEEETDPGETVSESGAGPGSSAQMLRSRRLPRPSSSRPASTEARHRTKS